MHYLTGTDTGYMDGKRKLQSDANIAVFIADANLQLVPQSAFMKMRD